MRLYHRARRMLDEADYSEPVARQLMSAVGELAVCVGWLAYDANDQMLARQLYSEALLVASQSGDDGLAIRAMEKMSLQSACVVQEDGRSGSAREAVRLSERARELTRHDPNPQLHALLASRAAIAHAAAGDRRGFSTAISHAWREVDRGFAKDAPAWLRFVNSSEIEVQEARGRLFLGEPVAAATLFRRSLEAALSDRNRATYRAHLATALAASGDVTGAVAEGMVVLPTLDQGGVMSPRTLALLHPVRRAAVDNRVGGDFCSHYDRRIGRLAT
jgi:hypothetical protein